MSERQSLDELGIVTLERTRKIVAQLVDDPDSSEMWAKFRYAQELRSGRPWLREHVDRQGLVGALNFALAYRFGKATEDRGESMRAKGALLAVDNDYIRRLKDGSKFMLREEIDVKSFSMSLDLFLGDQGLKGYVKESVEAYWQQCDARGFSGDPW